MSRREPQQPSGERPSAPPPRGRRRDRAEPSRPQPISSAAAASSSAAASAAASSADTQPLPLSPTNLLPPSLPVQPQPPAEVRSLSRKPTPPKPLVVTRAKIKRVFLSNYLKYDKEVNPGYDAFLEKCRLDRDLDQERFSRQFDFELAAIDPISESKKLKDLFFLNRNDGRRNDGRWMKKPIPDIKGTLERYRESVNEAKTAEEIKKILQPSTTEKRLELWQFFEDFIARNPKHFSGTTPAAGVVPLSFIKYATLCQIDLIEQQLNEVGRTNKANPGEIVVSGGINSDGFFQSYRGASGGEGDINVLKALKKKFDSDLGLHEASLKEAIRYPLEVCFKHQITPLRAGKPLNIAQQNPTTKEFKSIVGEECEIPADVVLSDPQYEALVSIDRAIARSKEGMGGLAAVRLATGAGKTFLSEQIKKIYGKLFAELEQVNITPSNIETDGVQKIFSDSERPSSIETDGVQEISSDKKPPLPNTIINIDEAFFLSPEFMGKDRGKTPEEISQKRYEAIRALRKKGDIVVVYGASESAEKMKVEVERLELKRDEIDGEVKELDRELQDLHSKKKNLEEIKKEIEALRQQDNTATAFGGAIVEGGRLGEGGEKRVRVRLQGYGLADALDTLGYKNEAAGLRRLILDKSGGLTKDKLELLLRNSWTPAEQEKIKVEIAQLPPASQSPLNSDSLDRFLKNGAVDIVRAIQEIVGRSSAVPVPYSRIDAHRAAVAAAASASQSADQSQPNLSQEIEDKIGELTASIGEAKEKLNSKNQELGDVKSRLDTRIQDRDNFILRRDKTTYEKLDSAEYQELAPTPTAQASTSASTSDSAAPKFDLAFAQGLQASIGKLKDKERLQYVMPDTAFSGLGDAKLTEILKEICETTGATHIVIPSVKDGVAGGRIFSVDGVLSIHLSGDEMKHKKDAVPLITPESKVISFFGKENSIGGDYGDFSLGITRQILHFGEREDLTTNHIMQWRGRCRDPENKAALKIIAPIEKGQLVAELKDNTKKDDKARAIGYLRHKIDDIEAKPETDRTDKDRKKLKRYQRILFRLSPDEALHKMEQKALKEMTPLAEELKATIDAESAATESYEQALKVVTDLGAKLTAFDADSEAYRSSELSSRLEQLKSEIAVSEGQIARLRLLLENSEEANRISVEGVQGVVDEDTSTSIQKKLGGANDVSQQLADYGATAIARVAELKQALGFQASQSKEKSKIEEKITALEAQIAERDKTRSGLEAELEEERKNLNAASKNQSSARTKRARAEEAYNKKLGEVLNGVEAGIIEPDKTDNKPQEADGVPQPLGLGRRGEVDERRTAPPAAAAAASSSTAPARVNASSQSLLVGSSNDQAQQQSGAAPLNTASSERSLISAGSTVSAARAPNQPFPAFPLIDPRVAELKSRITAALNRIIQPNEPSPDTSLDESVVERDSFGGDSQPPSPAAAASAAPATTDQQQAAPQQESEEQQAADRFLTNLEEQKRAVDEKIVSLQAALEEAKQREAELKTAAEAAVDAASDDIALVKTASEAVSSARGTYQKAEQNLEIQSRRFELAQKQISELEERLAAAIQKAQEEDQAGKKREKLQEKITEAGTEFPIMPASDESTEERLRKITQHQTEVAAAKAASDAAADEASTLASQLQPLAAERNLIESMPAVIQAALALAKAQGEKIEAEKREAEQAKEASLIKLTEAAEAKQRFVDAAQQKIAVAIQLVEEAKQAGVRVDLRGISQELDEAQAETKPTAQQPSSLAPIDDFVAPIAAKEQEERQKAEQEAKQEAKREKEDKDSRIREIKAKSQEALAAAQRELAAAEAQKREEERRQREEAERAAAAAEAERLQAEAQEKKAIAEAKIEVLRTIFGVKNGWRELVAKSQEQVDDQARRQQELTAQITLLQSRDGALSVETASGDAADILEQAIAAGLKEAKEKADQAERESTTEFENKTYADALITQGEINKLAQQVNQAAEAVDTNAGKLAQRRIADAEKKEIRTEILRLEGEKSEAEAVLKEKQEELAKAERKFVETEARYKTEYAATEAVIAEANLAADAARPPTKVPGIVMSGVAGLVIPDDLEKPSDPAAPRAAASAGADSAPKQVLPWMFIGAAAASARAAASSSTTPAAATPPLAGAVASTELLRVIDERIANARRQAEEEAGRTKTETIRRTAAARDKARSAQETAELQVKAAQERELREQAERDRLAREAAARLAAEKRKEAEDAIDSFNRVSQERHDLQQRLQEANTEAAIRRDVIRILTEGVLDVVDAAAAATELEALSKQVEEKKTEAEAASANAADKKDEAAARERAINEKEADKKPTTAADGAADGADKKTDDKTDEETQAAKKEAAEAIITAVASAERFKNLAKRCVTDTEGRGEEANELVRKLVGYVHIASLQEALATIQRDETEKESSDRNLQQQLGEKQAQEDAAEAAAKTAIAEASKAIEAHNILATGEARRDPPQEQLQKSPPFLTDYVFDRKPISERVAAIREKMEEAGMREKNKHRETLQKIAENLAAIATASDQAEQAHTEAQEILNRVQARAAEEEAARLAEKARATAEIQGLAAEDERSSQERVYAAQKIEQARLEEEAARVAEQARVAEEARLAEEAARVAEQARLDQFQRQVQALGKIKVDVESAQKGFAEIQGIMANAKTDEEKSAAILKLLQQREDSDHSDIGLTIFAQGVRGILSVQDPHADRGNRQMAYGKLLQEFQFLASPDDRTTEQTLAKAAIAVQQVIREDEPDVVPPIKDAIKEFTLQPFVKKIQAIEETEEERKRKKEYLGTENNSPSPQIDPLAILATAGKAALALTLAVAVPGVGIFAAALVLFALRNVGPKETAPEIPETLQTAKHKSIIEEYERYFGQGKSDLGAENEGEGVDDDDDDLRLPTPLRGGANGSSSSDVGGAAQGVAAETIAGLMEVQRTAAATLDLSRAADAATTDTAVAAASPEVAEVAEKAVGALKAAAATAGGDNNAAALPAVAGDRIAERELD